MDSLPKMSLSISISIFSKMTLSISIFSKNVLIDIDISMNVFIDIDIDIDIFKSDLIDIDIFKTCRYIDNRYGLSIYRTPLIKSETGQRTTSKYFVRNNHTGRCGGNIPFSHFSLNLTQSALC